jgi:dihydrofolate synthase/folylpolyglutamate synthase
LFFPLLTYPQSIQLLFGLERLGMKFGLEGISRLLRELKNPHRKFASIHVAGTNGKGSTASMLAAMLTAAGYKTGLYTSPHLVNFEERIRIGGKLIPRKAVAELISRLRRSIEKNRPTFFEATTAMAFAYFAEQKVDIAVIETGLGGRLDSTNVLRPLISVITNIALEHTEILGDSIEEIAFEKGGIVKRGVPCVTGISDTRALAVLKKICSQNHAPLVLGTRYHARVRKSTLAGTSVDLALEKSSYKNLQLSLAGKYQIANLGVALATVQTLNSTSQFAVGEDAIRAGLSGIQQLTGLSGRLAVIRERPLIVADVAHNSDAMRNLCDTWKRLSKGKPIVVFGVVKDKDYSSMVHALARVADQAVAVAAHSPRSRPASDVAAAFEKERCPTRAALSVKEGMNLAIQLAGNEGTILVTGSHYVVGEAMAALGRKRA